MNTFRLPVDSALDGCQVLTGQGAEPMSDWEPRESIHALRRLAGAQVAKIMDPTGHKMVRIFLEALGPAEYAARQRPRNSR